MVFITGVLEETVRLGAEKLGLDGLLLKPFEKPDVLALIDKILSPSNYSYLKATTGSSPAARTAG